MKVRKIRIERTAATLIPGDINPHGQELIRRTGMKSATRANQVIYELKCGRCKSTYGANGCDVHLRRCPNCDNGTPGEPLPETQQVSLFAG